MDTDSSSAEDGNVSHSNPKMAKKKREWQKCQKELSLLLQGSDTDDEHQDIENSDSLPGTPSSGGSDDEHSFISDSVPGTSERFDFDTDVDYWSTDSDNEPNNDAEVTSSFEDDL
ncbi:hypothetical protein DPEC_G00178290 [Dallia pectoralis]|uniref:Uncharacterized protein n=1 Tax=Dallia pectoralis TaxID=75939 RepID=A0ACC2GF36_DALPE|nr:hypothetical protein DPEC_G00178290 [Dallia pectoralis]